MAAADSFLLPAAWEDDPNRLLVPNLDIADSDSVLLCTADGKPSGFRDGVGSRNGCCYLGYAYFWHSGLLVSDEYLSFCTCVLSFL